MDSEKQNKPYFVRDVLIENEMKHGAVNKGEEYSNTESANSSESPFQEGFGGPGLQDLEDGGKTTRDLSAHQKERSPPRRTACRSTKSPASHNGEKFVGDLFIHVTKEPNPSTPQCQRANTPPYYPSSKVCRQASKLISIGCNSEEDWNDVTVEDAEPLQHCFCPARSPGPQLDMTRKYSPLELFQLFFSFEAVQSLCANTNKNGERRVAKGIKYPWTPVSIEEMYHFFSVMIYMGLVVTRTSSDYWSKHPLYSFNFVKKVMTGKRFHAINWTLHISDPDEDIQNYRKRGTPEFDRLFSIRPLLDTIVCACKKYYHPRKNIAIDERMVASKQRCGFKQYMKTKPIKWGFKIFVLADSYNGYTYNFFIYTGKCHVQSRRGIGYDTVMELLRSSDLGTGYHLYVDSFYTSTALFEDLYRLKFGACGTIRESNLGFLRTRRNRMSRKAARGTIRWMRSGELLFTSWMDSREVHLCSTIHRAFSGDQVKRRVQRSDGSWGLQQVPVPAPIVAYNRYMGGVDVSNSLIKYGSTERKAWRWCKRLFQHLLNMAVLNSYLLQKELAIVQGVTSLNQKEFRQELCMQLSQIGTIIPDPERKEEGKQECPMPLCVPVSITEGEVLLPCEKTTYGRKYCTQCQKTKKRNKTIWMCNACKVPLCIITDRNCFREWHLELTKKKNV